MNRSHYLSWHHQTSYSGSLSSLDLVDLLLGLDVGQRILVDVIVPGGRLSLCLIVLLLVLVEKRILEISHGDSVSLEEPLFELLDHRGLQGSNVLVQLYDLVSDQLDLFEFELVVPFADFLLFDEFELLLIDDVLGQFLWSLILFLLVQFV